MARGLGPQLSAEGPLKHKQEGLCLARAASCCGGGAAAEGLMQLRGVMRAPRELEEKGSSHSGMDAER